MKGIYSCFSLCLFLFILNSCSKKENDPIDIIDDPDEIAESYNDMVMTDEPVGFWALESDNTNDLTSFKHNGNYIGKPGDTQLPNQERASVFDGTSDYFEIPDAEHLELTKTGVLTIEAWMRPDVLDFPKSQNGYIHWMGKGTPGQHSWVARMYNKSYASRPQRISGYSFNLDGGLGAGSYFQDVISPGTWIHYALIINTKNTSTQYPTGYTKIYKDGKLRDQDSLKGYDIIPGDGNAPIRVATRDMDSYFKGAIGKVAIYDYEVSPEQLLKHNSFMRKK